MQEKCHSLNSHWPLGVTALDRIARQRRLDVFLVVSDGLFAKSLASDSQIIA